MNHMLNKFAFVSFLHLDIDEMVRKQYNNGYLKLKWNGTESNGTERNLMQRNMLYYWDDIMTLKSTFPVNLKIAYIDTIANCLH